MLEEESKKFTTINTSKGLFQYQRLPFGISSAPAIFQRAMDSLMQGLPNVVVYLDDILVSGKSEEDHLQSLDRVLDRLESAGVTLKEAKCIFLASSIEYLGHVTDKDGLHPSQEKLRAIQEALEPHNVTELKSFLGLLNYYSKFLPNLAVVLFCLLSTGCSRKMSIGLGLVNSPLLSLTLRNCCSCQHCWFTMTVRRS